MRTKDTYNIYIPCSQSCLTTVGTPCHVTFWPIELTSFYGLVYSLTRSGWESTLHPVLRVPREGELPIELYKISWSAQHPVT